MTILLAALHAFKTNKNFEPDGLYFGIGFLDFCLIMCLLG